MRLNDFNNNSSTDIYSYEEDILNGLKNDKCIVVPAALSNVLQFPIQYIYPVFSNVCVDKNFFKSLNTNLLYLPKSLKLRILWSHTTNANLPGWSPNRFFL